MFFDLFLQESKHATMIASWRCLRLDSLISSAEKAGRVSKERGVETRWRVSVSATAVAVSAAAGAVAGFAGAVAGFAVTEAAAAITEATATMTEAATITEATATMTEAADTMTISFAAESMVATLTVTIS